jgi:signal transduction histidine kinase
LPHRIEEHSLSGQHLQVAWRDVGFHVRDLNSTSGTFLDSGGGGSLGGGLSLERLPFIFGRFEQAVSSRHYGGLGLGLYIVRQIVELHGGFIQVKSTPGQGSTFTVRLPQS